MQQDAASGGEEPGDPVIELKKAVGTEPGRQEVVRLERDGILRARDGTAVPATFGGEPPELPPVTRDQGDKQASREESCEQHGPVR